MKHKTLIFLILILIIGTFFRIYKLGSVPISLSWDEVSWGYNAYSILQTGKDEHGRFLPLTFEAFGDFKQPLYVYVTVPSIALFGLNAFSVRFPSAVFGILGIVCIYGLSYELFFTRKNRDIYSLLSALLYAVSPWSIQFSRLAYEANIGKVLTMLGVWIFFRGFRKSAWIYLFTSAFILALSTYSYHSNKIIVPLLFLGLLILSLPLLKKQMLKSFILLVFFVLLIVPWLIDTRTIQRGRSVTVFSNQTEVLKSSIERKNSDLENNIIGSIFHDRRIEYAKKITTNYFKHFDLNYLFLKGFDVRHHAPDTGLFYIISIFSILVGMVYLTKTHNRNVYFIFYWLILGPVASALAMNSPNESRSLIGLPAWILIESVGLAIILLWLKAKKRGLWLVGFILFLYCINIFYYSHNYFVHLNTETEKYWQYGYKEAVEFVNKNKFGKVIFDDSIEQGYIFYLFYLKYDPKKYLMSGGSQNRSNCFRIENNYFGTDCLNAIERDDIVVTTKDLSNDEYKIVQKVFYQDKTPAVIIEAKK